MTPSTARRYVCQSIDTPIGRLKLMATDVGLSAVLWQNDRPSRVRLTATDSVADHPILSQAERQLREYFAGSRQTFTVPLDVVGTPFQQSVWKALRTIPFGETRSYKQIAAQVGRPTATRAVGAANGRNPLSIIAPCHRVIGASGALTGFAAGLEMKAKLLALERDVVQVQRTSAP